MTDFPTVLSNSLSGFDAPPDSPGTFADGGEVEAGPVTGDDGLLSGARTGQLAPFLQWASMAHAGGRLLGDAIFPRVFAEGGEVEEHGPADGDDGFLSRSRPGSLFPFLQWHNWPSIFEQTAKPLVQLGMDALAGAAAGPAGPVVSGVLNAVGTLAEQFSAPAPAWTTPPAGMADPGMRRMPDYSPPPMTAMPAVSLDQLGAGARIDRTMTVNVLKPNGQASDPGMSERLRRQSATYLSHLR